MLPYLSVVSDVRRYLAETLLVGYRWVKETYSDTIVWVRVQISACFSARKTGKAARFCGWPLS
jgi:hypothetical protein